MRIVLPKYLYIADSYLTIEAWNEPVYQMATFAENAVDFENRLWLEPEKVHTFRELVKDKNRHLFIDLRPNFGYYGFLSFMDDCALTILFQNEPQRVRIIREALSRQNMPIEVYEGNKELDGFIEEYGFAPDILKLESWQIEGSKKTIERFTPALVITFAFRFNKAFLLKLGYKQIREAIGDTSYWGVDDKTNYKTFGE